jgi:hypothetical protein
VKISNYGEKENMGREEYIKEDTEGQTDNYSMRNKDVKRKEKGDDLAGKLSTGQGEGPVERTRDAAPGTIAQHVIEAVHDQTAVREVLGNRQDIIAEQQKDSSLKRLIDNLVESKEQPEVGDIALWSSENKRYWGQWESLKVMGGVLYRKFETNDGRGYFWQVIMPASLRHNFLRRVHEDKMTGHLGMTKTKQRVQMRAYWFKWREDVNKFCEKCDLCASRKPLSRKARAPMQQYLPGVTMERVSMDVLGPLPKSNKDNKFILLVCDYFTKWVEAFPMPNQEAQTVADLFVKEFVCRYGVPRKIFTDQGSNFQSELFNKVCAMLEIDKSRTTPYHPQSDGLVERMNRTIEAMLSMFIAPGQRDWDDVLPYVMMAYRSAVQETTGYSPNQMMLGREAELPIDIVMGHPEEGIIEGNQHEYVDKMKEQMTWVHNMARGSIQLKSNHQKRNYDLKARPLRYEVGNAVWLHNPARKKGVSPKLSRPWEGPFKVVKRLSDVTYRIQKSVKAKPKVVHFDRLKLYKGENPPQWENKDNEENVPSVEDMDETILYNVDEYTDEPNKEKDIPTEHEVEITKNDENASDNVEPYITKWSKRTIRKPTRYQ